MIGTSVIKELAVMQPYCWNVRFMKKWNYQVNTQFAFFSRILLLYLLTVSIRSLEADGIQLAHFKQHRTECIGIAYSEFLL